MDGKERRRHERLESFNLLNYAVCVDHGEFGASGMGRTLNVSKGGILLETNVRLELGTRLALTIGLEEQLLELKGQVTRVAASPDKTFDSGVEFVQIDPESSELLKEYLKAFEANTEG